MQPSPVLVSYEATKNRGPDAGSVDMSYDILNVPIKRKKDPVSSYMLGAFCNNKHISVCETIFFRIFLQNTTQCYQCLGVTKVLV